jgi:hydrogenase nickel incorporation protein HypA/HybF
VHELSIAGAVVDTALKHAAGRRVTVVTVRAGALRQVVPESLEFYFGFVTRDTLCEGARLELEPVPARLRCCGREWEMGSLDFRCARCGQAAELIAGDELEVESIEVEEALPCTASG